MAVFFVYCSAKFALPAMELTHTLTHTGKSPYGTSGTRSAKEDAEGEGKGLKMPLHRRLKGFGTFRNQQVACSSHVTSSIYKGQFRSDARKSASDRPFPGFF